jgi:hypothetical protein
MPHHAEVQEEGVGFAFDKTGNLPGGKCCSWNRPYEHRMVKCDNEAAPVRAKNATQANLFPGLAQKQSPMVKRYTISKNVDVMWLAVNYTLGRVREKVR